MMDLWDYLWNKLCVERTDLTQEERDLVRMETDFRLVESMSANKPRGSNIAPHSMMDLSCQADIELMPGGYVPVVVSQEELDWEVKVMKNNINWRRRQQKMHTRENRQEKN